MVEDEMRKLLTMIVVALAVSVTGCGRKRFAVATDPVGAGGVRRRDCRQRQYLWNRRLRREQRVEAVSGGARLRYRWEAPCGLDRGRR